MMKINIAIRGRDKIIVENKISGFSVKEPRKADHQKNTTKLGRNKFE